MTYRRPVERAWRKAKAEGASASLLMDPPRDFRAGFDLGLRLGAQRAAEMLPELAEAVANGMSADLVAYAVESGNAPEPDKRSGDGWPSTVTAEDVLRSRGITVSVDEYFATLEGGEE